jgi:hypothetical protein
MSCNNKAFKYSKNFINEFNKIIEPLQHLNMPIFSYIRIIDNNRYLMLSNHIKWLQYHYQNIHNQGEFFTKESTKASTYKTHHCFWPTIPTDQVLTALYDHNIWNGISFFKKTRSILERFCFATSVDDFKLNSFYFNNIDLLKHFLNHFIDKRKIILKNYNHDYLGTFTNIQNSIDDHIIQEIPEEKLVINYPISPVSIKINGNNIKQRLNL